MTSKFALYGMSGAQKSYWRVTTERLTSTATKPAKSPAHHIAIVDASGSMCSDIGELKTMLEKLFTLEEFSDPTLRITLISYASMGDKVSHFAGKTVADVMKSGSDEVKQIRALHVRGLTCISQALTLAEDHIKPDETTCISLHSDGYANDASPTSEAEKIQKAVEHIRSRYPLAFVNTVAYRDSSDFNMLAKVANLGAGKCVQAKTVRDVYQALHDTTGLLAGAMRPVIEVPLDGADRLVVVSFSGKKVVSLGAGQQPALRVQGLSADDDVTAFRYFTLTPDWYAVSEAPRTDTGSLSPLYALARALISEGRINQAKQAVVTTRDALMLGMHAKALTTPQIAEFAAALETSLFGQQACSQQPMYGLQASGPSVLRVLDIISEHRGAFRVHLPTLRKVYQRRGLKQLDGKRLPDGTIEALRATTKAVDPAEEWLGVSGVELNRTTATVNLRLVQDVDLYTASADQPAQPVRSVAGIKLDLKEYRNYTIVGDGDLNVSRLRLQCSDKRAVKALVDAGAAPPTLQPGVAFDIVLKDLPVVEFDQSFAVEASTIETLLRFTVLQKALSACLKGETVAYTPEQVQALAAYHLTPALYFSPPRTTAYLDMQAAIAKGEVDSRPSYEIRLGTPEITSAGDLYSGNEFLRRRFKLNRNGTDVEKPSLDMVLDFDGVWDVKALTGKTKLNAIDDLMFPIFSDLLGLHAGTDYSGTIDRILKDAKLDAKSRKLFEKAIRGKLDADQTVEALTRARIQIDRTIDGLYAKEISPLVFYIGSTGIVPEEIATEALKPEQLQKKFSEVKLNKAERESGAFYVLANGLLLSIYATSEYYTVETRAAVDVEPLPVPVALPAMDVKPGKKPRKTPSQPRV